MKLRTPLKLYTALREDLGDLLTWRALPLPGLDHLDPFLFLNHHGLQIFTKDNEGLPFAPHPHRGFETVTFVLAGDLVHSDSAGHTHTVHAGGVQWMTAGRGILHSELSSEEFRKQGGELEILQFWVNLPGSLKGHEPRYFGLEASELPLVLWDDERIRLRPVAGTWMQVAGPVPPLAGVHMARLDFEVGGRLELSLPADHALCFYVARGELIVNGQSVPARRLQTFAQDGEGLAIQAVKDSILILGHGPQQREPIVAHGPFVMNTRQEILQALEDYQNGKFGE